jgi:hypothetical protein
MVHSLLLAVVIEMATINRRFGAAELKPTAHHPYLIRLLPDAVSA